MGGERGVLRIMGLLAILVFAGTLSCSIRNTTEQLQAREVADGRMAAGKDVSILQSYSGDYPVSGLDRLPAGQQKQRTGWIGTVQEFARVWQLMFPGQAEPEIDFKVCIVVFSRNVQFYNRISIHRIILKDGVIEVLARETMSALPIEGKTAMALAVIPREGIKFIRTEAGMTEVARDGTGPLDAVYSVDGKGIRLNGGRAEEVSAPGSAGKTVTSVFGKPVYGDLDGDGDEDAALILVRSPGGSGTFFYAAASVNEKGSCRGTNAVFLGDRISPQGLMIQKGLILANYAVRRPGQAMTVLPSEGRTTCLKLVGGILEETKP
jgi:hypothetical protein